MNVAVKLSTARMPISHVQEQWSGYCQRFSPYTRLNYNRALKQFIGYSQCRCLRDISTASIQVFVNSLLSTHKSGSINAKIIALKSLFSWCSDIYNLPNPALKIRFLPDNPDEARCLSDEEYRKCLEVTKGRDYHLIRFLANTGLRLGELESLTPASINGNWLTVKGKGSKTRHVPVNEHALESLQVVMKFSKNRSIVGHQCRRIAKKAGIPRFHPHSLRHFFATRCLAKGIDIHALSRMLGHSSVKITEHYYHYRPEHLAGLTDCLE